MYEGIIDALMKLFALMIIHSKLYANLEHAKSLVRAYLKARYNTQLSNKYFSTFEEYCQLFSEDESSKKGEISIHFLSACKQINNEYNFEVKVNFLLNLLKFSVQEQEALNDEINFLDQLTRQLRIDEATYYNLKSFVLTGAVDVQDKTLLRIVKGNDDDLIKDVKYIINPNQIVEIQFLWLPTPNLLLVRYTGARNMYINGHKMIQDNVYIFPPGAMIKTSRIHPVYQSDIMASYIQKEGQARIVYTAEDVKYKFNRNQIGLHCFNFRETSGHFVGILGGSGVGKTTLINVLNGNLKPSSGSIKINGHDLHEEKHKLEGIIAYVPQDDLLIEELTVAQNLYFNAKLCFGEMSEELINEKVEASLLDFDLIEARDLTVGSPMKKVLSGGQRKRLNIALELMREPLVLLADEPTSGLSSMDTEKVVSLLKRQTLKGGLVIANIHQPASDIYKQFDRIIVMDKGGRVVYSGNPLDAIAYFKRQANYINPEETDCPTCGNVKVEQPLRILEARMVSPTGRFIRQRKVSPEKWTALYRDQIESKIKKHIEKKKKKEDIPENAFKIPKWKEQVKTFLKRDILGKLTNKQYLMIAAIEAPLLALLFAFFAKVKINDVYLFADNTNLQSYLFMSIVVALFVGMSIAAEEIFKDRLILKREAFLNLSRSAYLSAKVFTLFAISALQMLIYVVIANNILEIRGMTFYFWITLFSTACFANMLALNLSAGLKSIVAIYILIPLMLIPQLLLSGVIMDFQHMNSSGNPRYTPIAADLMAARWAYEAIAVEQYKNNEIHKYVFDERLEKEESSFTLYYRIPEVENIIYTLEKGIESDQKKSESYYLLLQNEMRTLSGNSEGFSWIKKDMSLDEINKLKTDLKQLKSFITKEYNEKSDQYLLAQDELESRFESKEIIKSIRGKYINTKLEETLTGRYLKDRLIYDNNQIIQVDNPVFHLTQHHLGRSHFYAPYKMVLGRRIEVLAYNTIIIWLMILTLAIFLYTDLLRKVIVYFENVRLARATRNRERLENREMRSRDKAEQSKKKTNKQA